ncbi:MAG: GtrA family protein [Clostridia bacterium]|nr:GtrA family protein [Clostridia bacterium]
MNRLKEFYSRHKEILLYLLFGGITTVVSLTTCFITLKVGVLFIHDENGAPTELLDVLGSTLQWIAGVTVAFITNKKWVFKQAERGAASAVTQFFKFAGGRVATYFLEVAVNLGIIALLEYLGYRAFEVLGFSVTVRLWAKVISSFGVVVANYFISKLIVFKSKGVQEKQE